MPLKTPIFAARTLAFSAVCLVAAATAAGAQAAPPQAPAASQPAQLGATAPGHPPPPRGMENAGPADATPAVPDDPAKVAAARDFIIAYHPRMDPLNMASKIDQAMPGMIARARQQDPKLDVKTFAQKRREQLVNQSAHILDLQSHVVSRHFSVQELKDLTAFYRGPLGRKLNDELPKISLEVMQASRTMMPIGPGQVKMKVEPAQPATGPSAPKK